MIRKKYKLLLSLVLVCVFSFSCVKAGPEKLKRYSETRMLMGTYVTMDVCAPPQRGADVETAYQEAWKVVEDVSWRMNVFDEKSDVEKINQSFEAPARVHPDTYEVVREAVRFSEETGGAFEITVWPLVKLWRRAQERQAMPTAEQLAAVKQSVGYGNIRFFPDNRIQILHPQTNVDLGAIAKGYALDKAAEKFRAAGLKNFYLDGGGDVYVGGHNCRRQPWRIGIRDPRNREDIIEILHVQNASVTTSGNYEQYYEIDKMKFSHIINPVDGYPQKEVVSATVVAPKAYEADALATALTVLGGEKGGEFIESYGYPYACLIFEKNRDGATKRYQSRSLQQYLRVDQDI